VRSFFGRRAQTARRELRTLLRRGRTSLVIGVTFLTACVLAGELAARHLGPTGTGAVLQQGLTVAGWGAMWRPSRRVSGDTDAHGFASGVEAALSGPLLMGPRGLAGVVRGGESLAAELAQREGGEASRDGDEAGRRVGLADGSGASCRISRRGSPRRDRRGRRNDYRAEPANPASAVPGLAPPRRDFGGAPFAVPQMPWRGAPGLRHTPRGGPSR
jgi:hypothetical protein